MSTAHAKKSYLRVSASHMVLNLASELYASTGQCLMELIRNGLAASMPGPDVWDPKRARIELMLVKHHCLAPDNGPALIVLDHGSGLTAQSLERYFEWLGAPLEELRGQQLRSGGNGVSQKGIGRLAALALNERCVTGDLMDRVQNGYYLLTRTAGQEGVRFVAVIPAKAEADQGFETDRFISRKAREMQALGDVAGSFTAVVIPTPVFKTEGQVYDSIKWLLPRSCDRMFDLTINGKEVLPPPLEDELSHTEGAFSVHLGVAEKGEGGVWLCDAQTGLRVASCLNVRALPEPLWSPEITGDIFAPGLLAHQNTARSSLARDYMRRDNPEWEKLRMFLIREIAPRAKSLLSRDAIQGEAAETLNELAEMFNDVFGLPGKSGDIPANLFGVVTPRKRPIHVGPDEPDETEEPEAEAPRKEKRRYRRHITIKVRDEVYTLYRGLSLGEFVFAQANYDEPHLIEVNVRGDYRALPDSKIARREHLLMQILLAIGLSKFPTDYVTAVSFANEIRSEFNRK